MPRGFQRARQGPSARQIDHLEGHERPVQDDAWLVLVPRRSNRRRGVSTMSESRHRRRILAQATPQSRRACSHATSSTSCPLQISSRSLTNSFVTKPSVPDAISTTCGRTYASVDETVVTFELPGDLRGCMLRSSVRWGRTWIATHGGGDHCQEESRASPPRFTTASRAPCAGRVGNAADRWSSSRWIGRDSCPRIRQPVASSVSLGAGSPSHFSARSCVQ